MGKPEGSKIAIRNPKSLTKGVDHDDGGREYGFGDLPECLQQKILACLTVKSVFVFKSVSKQWNSFISTQDFSRSYVAENELFSPRNRTLLLLCNNINYDSVLIFCVNYHPETVPTCATMSQRLSGMNDELPFTMLDLPFPKRQPNQIGDEPYVVLSACDGLLLCTTRHNYGICNPITRQWIVFPRHIVPHSVTIYSRGAFVAKVDKSSSTLTSYRAVHLKIIVSNLVSEIYDSDTKEWTIAEVELPGRGVFNPNSETMQPACLNEIIHCQFSRGEVHYAVAVDPYKHGQDQCRFMVLPTTSIFSNETWATLLGVCNGRLQFLKIRKKSHDIAIWVLEDYDKEIWVLKHMLTGVNLSYRDHFDSGICKSLAFHPLDPNIIYIRCTTAYTVVIAFDIEKKTLSPLSTTRLQWFSKVFLFVLPLWPPVFDCPYTTTNLLSA